MQIPQSIAGMSSRWSRSDLRQAEGKAAPAREAGRAEPLELSQQAKQALSQPDGKVEDGALHAGDPDSWPEVAICPECGSANCGCLARLEAQQKLDEARAARRNTQRVNALENVA